MNAAATLPNSSFINSILKFMALFSHGALLFLLEMGRVPFLKTDSMPVIRDRVFFGLTTPIVGQVTLNEVVAGHVSHYVISVPTAPCPDKMFYAISVVPGSRMVIPLEFLSPESSMRELWGFLDNSGQLVPLLKHHFDADGNPTLYVNWAFVDLPSITEIDF